MSALTKVQKAELEELKQAAMAELKENPTYMSLMSAASFSDRIWAALDALFNEVKTANEKMPEQFDPSISSDIPAAVDSAATAYLATDVFRPRGGWTFSAKKRALKRELQEVMDQRAWIAALTLKRARLYLGQ